MASWNIGSPKVPLFPEALLLHHIDNMDSKMECMRAFIEKDRLVDGCWTSYVSSLDRSVLKKRKYLDTRRLSQSYLRQRHRRRNSAARCQSSTILPAGISLRRKAKRSAGGGS